MFIQSTQLFVFLQKIFISDNYLIMSGDDVRKILETNGYQLNEIAEKLSISPQNLNNWLNVKDIKVSTLYRIASAINKTIYFFFENDNGNLTMPEVQPDATVAPLISQFAYAGYLAGFADHDYLEAQPSFVAARRHNGGHYIAFEVRGDSMDDGTKRSICEGDILLGRELRKDLWQFRLHIPKVFVIVHRSDGIICKEIIAHDVESGIIVCHSWNPDPEYQDFEIDMRDVLQLFYVKEISRDNKY